MFYSLVASIFLLCLSALFSGLTLGLMGLDQMGLQVVIESGNRPEASEQERRDARYAKKIYPFRKRGNLLLCTLLFGNVAVNCLLSIIMADMTSGLVGFLTSTISIVIFGEILPQSLCSRHPLAIGAACVPLVYCFIILTFLASYPTSLILDQLLGEEIGTIYSRNQLKGMLQMYARMKDSDFVTEETDIMAGALDFGSKTVGECMTPIEDVFMLDLEDTLTFETIMRIFESGHSRVPVYQVDETTQKRKVLGLLYVKELVLVDPEDGLPVRTICHHWFGRDIPVVFDDVKTAEVLKVFKTGRSHMALVQTVVSEGDSDPYYKTIGIITLEDLIEEILQDEIYDEKDIVESHQSAGLGSRKIEKAELARKIAGGGELASNHPLLEYLAAKEKMEKILPRAEVEAISSFLRDKYQPIFGDSCMSRTSLEHLIQAASVKKWEIGDPAEEIYYTGSTTTVFTLIIDGQISVHAGQDGFECTRGPWDVFCQRVLQTSASVVTDFSAVVDTSRPVRLLQIDLKQYLDTARGRTSLRPSRSRRTMPPRAGSNLSQASVASFQTAVDGSPTRAEPLAEYSNNLKDGSFKSYTGLMSASGRRGYETDKSSGREESEEEDRASHTRRVGMLKKQASAPILSQKQRLSQTKEESLPATGGNGVNGGWPDSGSANGGGEDSPVVSQPASDTQIKIHVVKDDVDEGPRG